jgi:hypothetical protein
LSRKKNSGRVLLFRQPQRLRFGYGVYSSSPIVLVHASNLSEVGYCPPPPYKVWHALPPGIRIAIGGQRLVATPYPDEVGSIPRRRSSVLDGIPQHTIDSKPVASEHQDRVRIRPP